MVISRTSPEWNELEFGAICDVQNGYAFKSENFISHGIPIIKIANIQDGKVIIDEASSYPEISISDNFLVNTGDILLAMSGATTGKVGVYTGKRRLYLNQRVCKMVCKGSLKTYYPYVKYLLSSNLFVKQLESSLTAGAQPNLSPKQVRKMVFKIPSYEEQKAIATALSDMDELIANLEKLIEKKNAIKQGTMQELLTGKKRLPGFTDEWKEYKLDDLLKYEQPTKYIIHSTEYSDYGVPVLTAGKTFVLGYTNECDSVYDKLPVIIFDDFVTSSKYVDFKFKVKSSAMKFLTPKDDCNLRLVFELIQMINFIPTDHQRHWISRYSKFKIKIPSNRKEQDAIACIFSDIDNEIFNLRSKLDKYRQLKQGMMQKLLTGEIRFV